MIDGSDVPDDTATASQIWISGSPDNNLGDETNAVYAGGSMSIFTSKPTAKGSEDNSRVGAFYKCCTSFTCANGNYNIMI